MGMSDRPRGLTIEARMDDVGGHGRVGSTARTMLGWAETSNTCGVFAATYPERVERAGPLRAVCARHALGRLPWAPDAGRRRYASLAVDRERWGERDYLEDFARRMNPNGATMPRYLDWFVWTHRLSSSPESYVEFRRMTLDTDLSDVCPRSASRRSSLPRTACASRRRTSRPDSERAAW